MRSSTEQHDATLELAHRLGADLLLAAGVGLVGVLLQGLDHVVAVEPFGAADLVGHGVEVERHRPQLLELGLQRVEVPLLGEALGGPGDEALDDVVDEAADLVLEVRALEHLATLGVDHVALAVHHVVVLEDVLAGVEVLGLDLALGVGDRAGDPLVLDRDVVGDLEDLEDPVDPVGLEQPHQLVLEREVEPRLAGVALAAGTTAQLVVDTARLVSLGADDVEAADRRSPRRAPQRPGALIFSTVPGQAASYSSAVSPVGSRPRLRSSASARNSTEPPSMMSVPRPAMLVATVTAPLWPAMRDDLRLVGVDLGVQHRVRDAALAQLVGEVLGLLDRDGADQDRLALGVALGDVVDDRVVLGLLGAVDEVGLVDADHRLVGRDRDHAELVDLVELAGLGHGRAGHARRASRRGGSSSAA